MNVPNRITMARILSIPVYTVLMYSDMLWLKFVAGGIFVIAAITDSLDGYIARRDNIVTDLGKFLDPLADKLLVLTAIIILAAHYRRIPSLCVIIITARELIVTSLRTMAALKNRVVAADIFGKIKTTTQVVAVAAMHFELAMSTGIYPIYHTLTDVVFYFSVLMTVLSGVNYVYKNFDVIQE